MSKCHVTELQNLWEAILADASHAFPTLRAEFERDLNRLQRIVAHRGIRVFLEDLPAIGKHFDRCLSCGQYSLSGLPLSKRNSNNVVIPKFLRGLYLLVFHDSGQLKEDCNVEALFFVRQLTLAFKKGKIACSDEANEKEVVEFFVTDSSLPKPESFWEGSLSEATAQSPDEGSEPRATDTRPAERGCEGSPGGGPSITPEGSVLERGSSTGSETLAARRMIYEGFSRSSLYEGRVRSVSSPQKRRRLSILLANLDIVSSFVTASLGPYDPSIWRFRHGPGAVSEYRGPTNKYYWTNWSDTLESEFPIADYGFHSYRSWADRVHTGRGISSSELPSRMVCVPKTYSRPRLIAAEPSANQWCQQNMWHYFHHRSRSCWIYNFVRFRDQSYNQRLCKVGSRYGTLATLDLSSASDRVTCHAVGQMFRGNPRLLNCLRASRTHTVSQDITQRVPPLIPLRKFSTMGNACTFPIESLIFLSVTLAAVLTQRGLRPSPKNIRRLTGEVAVFGDDLIVPVDSRELLTDALEILDFKVNVHKSFWNGNFRESCGVDAFKGCDITPAYWRNFSSNKPESLASTVDTRNNFYKKFLLNAASQLASTLPPGLPVVAMRSGVFGLKSFIGPILSGLRLRGNDDLQRTEVFVLSRIGKQTKVPIEDDSALLQYFTETPDPFSKWTSGTPQRPRTLIRSRWVALSDFLAPCKESK